MGNYDQKSVRQESESSFNILCYLLRSGAQTSLAPRRSGWAAMQKKEHAISETATGIPASLLAVSTQNCTNARESQN
jgi:hypothetical protein